MGAGQTAGRLPGGRRRDDPLAGPDETAERSITSSRWWRCIVPARWPSSPITSRACTAKRKWNIATRRWRPSFRITYGIPVYQEQLMRAAVELAGYTPSESDELRKAISKKKNEEIEKHRAKFVKGAVEKGMDAIHRRRHLHGLGGVRALRLQQSSRRRLRRDRGPDRLP